MDSFNPISARKKLDERSKIAEIMSGQALQPLQSFNNAPISPVAAIAKVLQGYLAGDSKRGLADEEANYSKQYGEGLRTGMESYFRQKANPQNGRESVIFALTSPYQELQKLGAAELEGMGKNAVSTKDLLQYVKPSQIPALLANGSVTPDMVKRDLGEVGGQLYDKENLERVALGGNPGELVSMGGDTYQRNPTTGKLDKLDNAPRMSTTINMPRGESAFDMEFGKREAIRISDAMEKLPTAVSTLDSVDTALKLLGDPKTPGIYTGIAAPLVTMMSKVAAALGAGDGGKAVPTEQFRSIAQELVVQKSELLKGVATDKDMERLEKAAVGLETAEAGALRETLLRVQEGMRRKLAHENSALQQYKESGGRVPTMASPYVQSPESQAIGTPAPAEGATAIPGQPPQAPRVRKYNPATGRIE